MLKPIILLYDIIIRKSITIEDTQTVSESYPSYTASGGSIFLGVFSLPDC